MHSEILHELDSSMDELFERINRLYNGIEKMEQHRGNIKLKLVKGLAELESIYKQAGVKDIKDTSKLTANGKVDVIEKMIMERAAGIKAAGITDPKADAKLSELKKLYLLYDHLGANIRVADDFIITSFNDILDIKEVWKKAYEQIPYYDFEAMGEWISSDLLYDIKKLDMTMKRERRIITENCQVISKYLRDIYEIDDKVNGIDTKLSKETLNNYKELILRKKQAVASLRRSNNEITKTIEMQEIHMRGLKDMLKE